MFGVHTHRVPLRRSWCSYMAVNPPLSPWHMLPTLHRSSLGVFPSSGLAYPSIFSVVSVVLLLQLSICPCCFSVPPCVLTGRGSLTPRWFVKCSVHSTNCHA